MIFLFCIGGLFRTFRFGFVLGSLIQTETAGDKCAL
jgi:hypothetical protein